MEEQKEQYIARSKYKNKEYAGDYDYTRYEQDKHKKRRDINTQRSIAETLGMLDDCKLIMDTPCGTGRLARLVRDGGFSYILLRKPCLFKE